MPVFPGMMPAPGAVIPTSPAASPSPNPGTAANALNKVQQAVQLLQLALPELPVGSEVHKAVTGSISSLARHAPAMGTSPGIEQSALRDLAHHAMQQAPLLALMRAQGAQPGGAPGGTPGGGPPV